MTRKSMQQEQILGKENLDQAPADHCNHQQL